MDYQIIMVGANQEATVSRTLGILGFDHEWFRVKRRVVYRGKLAHRITPIFPGYLFIIAKFMFSLIERITGVRGFVRFGGRIENVDERVVMGLRDRADEDGIVEEDSLPFKRGQPVVVRIGGQETAGVFRDYLGPARVIVDVTMFGREVQTQARLGDCRVK